MISRGFVILLISAVLVAGLSWTRVFNGLELLSYDVRFCLRPPQTVSKEIVIIEIDDHTLNNLKRWPLPRDFHASLIDVLEEFGVRAVLFDLLFSEPTAEDAVFSESIAAARHIYLPFAFYLGDPAGMTLLTREHKILAPIAPLLRRSDANLGHINIVHDSDGKIRRVPLFIRHRQALVPQLSFRAAADWLGVKLKDAAFAPRTITIDDKVKIPVVDSNYMLVNYPDRWDRSFQRVSYYDVLKSYIAFQEGKKPVIDLKTLKGKVCFIGLTATGTFDLKPMPLEAAYPMVGLQASVFNSLIEKDFIRDVGVVANTFINLLIFILTVLISLRFPPAKLVAASLLLALGYMGIAVGVFGLFGLWIDLVLPLVVILVTLIATTLRRIFEEMRRREVVEKELEIAQSIQRSFLPQTIAQAPGVTLGALFQPARFVAGDLYDVWAIDSHRVGVFIGDVAGKGVSAALVMAQAMSLFRLLSRQHSGCADVLRRMNRELSGKMGGRFITALYVIVDTANLRIEAASAGHGPLLIHSKKDGKIIDVDLKGNVPLGLMDEVEYAGIEHPIGQGDKFFVFSDGLAEARNARGEEFGCERINRLIAENHLADNGAVLESFRQSIFGFSDPAKLFDDITLIVGSLESGKD